MSHILIQHYLTDEDKEIIIDCLKHDFPVSMMIGEETENIRGKDYKVGKWIEKEDDVYHGGGYTECSVCGQRYSWGGYFDANAFRYCPRCGHRMEEQEWMI